MNFRALKIVVASEKATADLICFFTTLLLLTVCSNNTASAQGVLANGYTYNGTIAPVGDSDTWTFTATNGDSIVIDIGEITSTNGFTSRIRLFNPNAVQQALASGTITAEIAVTATNTGTFTLIVDDLNGTVATGTYRLTMGKTGSPVVVAPGTMGGSMTNGFTYQGNLLPGQLSVWSFTANTGDSMVVGMGDANRSAGLLYPYVRIYGPNGALLDSEFGVSATESTARATNSGTFTVIAANDDIQENGGYGTNEITLGTTASPVVVAPGTMGGSMTNGFTYQGNLLPGQLSVWSFTANTGDSMVVGMGDANRSAGLLYPYVRIYGPNGALLDSEFGVSATESTARATNSGTFTVIAANDDIQENGGYGTNEITLGTTASPVVVAPGTMGGSMTNGFTYQGNLLPGQLSVWSFTANTGDSMVVGMGDANRSAGLLYPYVRIYGPNGALLDSEFGVSATESTARATNSGTFTVIAANDDIQENGGYGTNEITLGTTASPVVVAPGTMGGSMTNGFTYQGNLLPGQLSVWSFTANTGDSMVVGMGDANRSAGLLYPYVRIYGPNGALLDSEFGVSATESTARATNSGTFTVIAANDDIQENGGYGTNQVTMGKTGSPIVVSAGNQGGTMNGAGYYIGTNVAGGLSVWNFTAHVGDPIMMSMADLNRSAGLLYPYVRLYSRDGSLLNSVFGSTSASINSVAPVSGTFTLITANDDIQQNGGNGTYELAVNNLSGGFKVAGPVITGTNLDVGGIGGPPGTNFVIFTTTNVATPAALWTPLQTNQFDQFGVYDYTNGFNAAEPQRFFRLSYP